MKKNKGSNGQNHGIRFLRESRRIQIVKTMTFPPVMRMRIGSNAI